MQSPKSASAELKPVGTVRSTLTSLSEAPMQGHDGAPEAWLDIESEFSACLRGIRVGDELLLLTWLHRARRNVLETHPRDDLQAPLLGVFATRSPERPNPIGLHPITVLEINGNRLRVRPLEAIDGTPIVDLKPVL